MVIWSSVTEDLGDMPNIALELRRGKTGRSLINSLWRFHSVSASPRLICAKTKNKPGNQNTKDNAHILTLGSISCVDAALAGSLHEERLFYIPDTTYGLTKNKRYQIRTQNSVTNWKKDNGRTVTWHIVKFLIAMNCWCYHTQTWRVSCKCSASMVVAVA